MENNIIVEQKDANNSKKILDDKIFYFCEHEIFSEEQKATFGKLNIQFSQTAYEETPKFLGLSSEQASYYIGASWLTEDRAVVVKPKQINSDINQKTDFIKMFLVALKFSPSAEYFSKFYGINFEEKPIECESLNEQLTPLLIVHYLATLQKIVSCGLKKDYVIQNENLKSKVRGKILIQKNLQKNIFPQRYERTYCSFQEYTVDIPENRLLKKALIFASNFLDKLSSFEYHNSLKELKLKLTNIKSYFNQVSDEIENYQIKTFRKNKLFKDYSNAINLAKMILKRFDYSINNSNSIQKTVPPFWIDMSRLYEVYVYSILDKAYPHQIKFQVKGRLKTAVDFIKIDEKLILDAKYKTKYQKGNPILADIRELSGYARDDKILKSLKIKKESFETEENVIKCVIIYPEKIDIELEENMDEEEKSEIQTYNSQEITDIKFSKPISELIKNQNIPGFRKFYKLSIPLPIL